MGTTASTEEAGASTVTLEKLKRHNEALNLTCTLLSQDKSRMSQIYRKEAATFLQTKTRLHEVEIQLEKLKLESNTTATRLSDVTQVENCTQTDEDDSALNARIVNAYRTWAPYIPYSPEIMDRWFTTLVTSVAEPAHNFCVEMYNAQSYVSVAWTVDSKVSEILGSGEKMYYHGTDAGSVRNILEHGIDLEKSKRSMDFSSGGGFYVTDNLQQAVDWAKRVARWTRSRGAVIGFKIGYCLLLEQPHLSLSVNSDTEMTFWRCIVSHFRQGQRSPDVTNVLKDMKFISGPVAMNAYLGPEEIPSPKWDYSQMCICDEQYAKRFGSLDNIPFVIFFY